MHLGGVAKAWREFRGLEVPELSARAKIPPTTIYDFERGDIARIKKLHELARALGITQDTLLDRRMPPTAGKKGLPVTFDSSVGAARQIPFASWSEPDAKSGNKIEGVLAPEGMSEESFALRVADDSNEPRIPRGTIVLVDPKLKPEAGQFVVVRIQGDPEASLKQYSVVGGKVFLKPANPQYQAASSSGAKIVGVVAYLLTPMT